jgi:dihydrofolate reductase
MNQKIYLIAAADLKNGIGIKGKLPWNLKKDLRFFQKTTITTEDAHNRNMVIMGSVTWDSLPAAHRPLPGRKNVVLHKDRNFKAEGAVVANSIQQALEIADDRIESVFFMGGASVYDQAIKRRDIDGIYLTRIKKEFKCDTYFPKIPNAFKAEKIGEGEENGVRYEFLFYRKKKKK